VDAVLGREYPLFFTIAGVTVAPRNPLLEELLPSLLQIKAVTVLDEALGMKLADAGQNPKSYGFRDNLHGRIETALAAGILKDAALLHRVRNSRNDAAHEFAERLDWPRLDADISVIHDALKQMGFVGPRPDLKVKAERVPKTTTDNPAALFGFEYRVTVYDGDSVWAEIKWATEVLRDEP
jgi:hypothetical protein